VNRYIQFKLHLSAHKSAYITQACRYFEWQLNEGGIDEGEIPQATTLWMTFEDPEDGYCAPTVKRILEAQELFALSISVSFRRAHNDLDS